MESFLRVQEAAKLCFALLQPTDRWAAASQFVGVAFDADGVYAVGETGDENFGSPGYATNRWRVLTWEEVEHL